jgi:hypothetical protein
MRTFHAVKICELAACVIALAIVSPASAAAQEGVTPDSAPPSEWTSPADSARSYDEPTSVWNAHRVVRVLGGGTHVVLGDGTIWEIYLPDRPSVNMWRRGDLLLVRESSVSQGEFDYNLTDGRTRGAVSAGLVGAAPRRG